MLRLMSGSSTWFPMAGIGGAVVASIIYRLKVGKPIYPEIAPDALFAERRAGGPWASNCLLVSVTIEELRIEPAFPFNLMFLPEIWGAEYRVPISEIKSAELSRGWLMNTKIGLKDGKTISLRLKLPDSFLQALKTALSQSKS
ncbi:hypothetical protein OIK40_04240 [Erythrobacter sp. sf7]|uniref:Uncharacterized protein n=1 Tax=Erythrobacter fulvus TaxID=2987523 RepID=A0ABT5JMJ9_9SPHN|nr:hypothetical protein [Erythrobacter fulvus]MDC8753849.1 hypothetical protein [Erythrobacter fulvus]